MKTKLTRIMIPCHRAQRLLLVNHALHARDLHPIRSERAPRIIWQDVVTLRFEGGRRAAVFQDGLGFSVILRVDVHHHIPRVLHRIGPGLRVVG